MTIIWIGGADRGSGSSARVRKWEGRARAGIQGRENKCGEQVGVS